jgi:DNA-binding transcriptional LysR family regulator
MVRPPFGLQSELSWYSLAHEPLVLLVPSSLADCDWREALQSWPFIRYERTSFGGRVVDQFLRKAGLQVQEAMEVDEIDALIRAVEVGIGLSIAPLKTTHIPLPKGVRALPIDGVSLYREIGVAVRINRKHPIIVDRLIELLQSNVQRLASGNQPPHPDRPS